MPAIGLSNGGILHLSELVGGGGGGQTAERNWSFVQGVHEIAAKGWFYVRK